MTACDWHANKWICHNETSPFRYALLETDGAPEVMTVIQVFTQCFVQAYQENNKRVSQAQVFIILKN